MNDKRALDLAIFAINTFLHPDASSDADLATLDDEGRKAVKRLGKIRDRLDAEPDYCGEDFMAGTICTLRKGHDGPHDQPDVP